MNDCIFCKIVSGDIPSYKIFEDGHVFAFLDINPVNPGHTLVIPKKHAKDLFEVDEQSYLETQKIVRELAPKIKEAVGACGVNIMQNSLSCAGQVVEHLHIHIIPRFEGDGHQMWHGKELDESSAKEIQARIQDMLHISN